MKIPSTNDLLKRLNETISVTELEHYEQEAAKYHLTCTFPEFIEQQRKKADITPAKLIEKAQIQRNYGYQILNGVKKPGRDKIISLCLALNLSLEETQRALTIAKEGILYPKNTRDSVLIFCINQKLSVMDTNELLDIREEELL